MPFKSTPPCIPPPGVPQERYVCSKSNDGDAWSVEAQDGETKHLIIRSWNRSHRDWELGKLFVQVSGLELAKELDMPDREDR